MSHKHRSARSMAGRTVAADAESDSGAGNSTAGYTLIRSSSRDKGCTPNKVNAREKAGWSCSPEKNGATRGVRSPKVERCKEPEEYRYRRWYGVGRPRRFVVAAAVLVVIDTNEEESGRDDCCWYCC